MSRNTSLILAVLTAVSAFGAAPSRTIPRTVPTWADLANEDIRAHWQGIYVLEEGIQGMVVAVQTASLPAWASTDYNGYSKADSSGTGKWLYLDLERIDIRRCGGDPTDGSIGSDNAALSVASTLAAALGVSVYLPPGNWDVSEYDPTVDITIVGDGDASILDGDDGGADTYSIFNGVDQFSITLKDVKMIDAYQGVDLQENYTSLVTGMDHIELLGVKTSGVYFPYWLHRGGATALTNSVIHNIRIEGCYFAGPGNNSCAAQFGAFPVERIDIHDNEVTNFQWGFCISPGEWFNAAPTGVQYGYQMLQDTYVTGNNIHDLVNDGSTAGTTCKGIVIDTESGYVANNRFANYAVGVTGTAHYQSAGVYAHTPSLRLINNLFDSTGNYAYTAKGNDLDQVYSSEMVYYGAGAILDGNSVVGTLKDAAFFWVANSARCVNNQITCTFSGVSGAEAAIYVESSASKYVSTGANVYIGHNRIRCDNNIGVRIHSDASSANLDAIIEANDINLTDTTGGQYGIQLFITTGNTSYAKIKNNWIRCASSNSSAVFKSGSIAVVVDIEGNIFDTAHGITYSAGSMDGRIAYNDFSTTGVEMNGTGGTLAATLQIYNNYGIDTTMEGHLHDNYVVTVTSSPSGNVWLTPRVDGNVQVVTDGSSLTDFNLSSTNAVVGTSWRVVNQDVTNRITLRNTDGSTPILDMPQSSWADVAWSTNGTTYVLTANGFLGDEFYNDLLIPLLSGKLAASHDPGLVKVSDNGSGSVGVYGYGFDSGAEEEILFSMQVPYDWKEGTDLEIHIHWCASDANSGSVVWGLETEWQDIGGTYSTSSQVTSTNAVSGTAFLHQLSDIVTLDGSGHTGVSGIVLGRLFRNGGATADDYGADAIGLSLDAHYQINKLGESTH